MYLGQQSRPPPVLPVLFKWVDIPKNPNLGDCISKKMLIVLEFTVSSPGRPVKLLSFASTTLNKQHLLLTFELQGSEVLMYLGQ